MLTRKIFIPVLLAAVLMLGLLGSAFAQTSNLYFAGYLGLSLSKDHNFSETSVPISGTTTLKNSVGFAGALGLRVTQNFRVELEYSRRSSDMDRMDIDNLGSFKVGGDLTSNIGMLNVYYDFDMPSWNIQPFLGAGVGVGFHDANIDDISGFAVDRSDSATNMVWQVGGGLKYRVSPDLAFSAGYRYVDGTDLDIGSYTSDYGGHEIRIGLEYDLPY